MVEPYAVRPGDYSDYIEDYLQKMRHFNQPHRADIWVEPGKYRIFEAVVQRLGRLQRTAGYGHFGLLDFDEGLVLARDYSRVGAFPKEELDFLEMIFYTDAAKYGFFGEKALLRMTDRIPRNEVVKIPGSGNYLYKGLPLETYRRIERDVGPQAILTSGVRGVMKQFLLFLRKAYENEGNLSLASRSLAPPGFSFHGISDFDLGQVGLGLGNFTERFTSTTVYRKLEVLEYLNLRYPRDNMLGVRFEPWHIRVNSRA
ncbi:MAG: M15 family metallopeptidase [Candidatus Binatia bacterium]